VQSLDNELRKVNRLKFADLMLLKSTKVGQILKYDYECRIALFTRAFVRFSCYYSVNVKRKVKCLLKHEERHNDGNALNV
jgi:hypothetical protein